MAYNPTYSMMNRDNFHYTKHYPNGRDVSKTSPPPEDLSLPVKTVSTSPPPLRLTTGHSPRRRNMTSIKDFLDLETAPHETVPQAEEDEEEVRRLLFARSIGDTPPSSSHSPIGAWADTDPIVESQSQPEVGMVSEGTQVRTKNLGYCMDAVTQVNSEVCSCGRSHHSSPCRSHQGSPVRVISDYCVHATTTTKVDTPRYALPTWSSWPVASRFSPVEIDPSSKIPKSPRRRSPSPLRRRQSPSPLPRRPSPSPLKRGRLLVRSPSYEASTRLYDSGMEQKVRKDLLTAAAQQAKVQSEKDEADRYKYQPNIFRSASQGRRGSSIDTFTKLYNEKKPVSPAPVPPRSASNKPDWKIGGTQRTASPFEKQFMREQSAKMMNGKKKKKKRSPAVSPKQSRPPVPQKVDLEREKEAEKEKERQREKQRELEREKEREREREREKARRQKEDDLIERLFDIVDQDKDGFWSYEEAVVWGRVTDAGEMTKDDWVSLCQRLGADSRIGLPLQAVKRTYATTGAAAEHLDAMQRYPQRSGSAVSITSVATSLDYLEETDFSATARTTVSRVD
eukprot:TRINITY_DN1187_c1_g1_i1.p1 TRINITY_DN1187_c1_g1~~TRINITY_DN1187_c1_g1_i1.p1  ORF type:complete len:565 (+),score=71.38 TRINITY_DN1187_c1_g1_i1:240-1934(+)